MIPKGNLRGMFPSQIGEFWKILSTYLTVFRCFGFKKVIQAFKISNILYVYSRQVNETTEREL